MARRQHGRPAFRPGVARQIALAIQQDGRDARATGGSRSSPAPRWSCRCRCRRGTPRGGSVRRDRATTGFGTVSRVRPRVMGPFSFAGGHDRGNRGRVGIIALLVALRHRHPSDLVATAVSQALRAAADRLISSADFCSVAARSMRGSNIEPQQAAQAGQPGERFFRPAPRGDGCPRRPAGAGIRATRASCATRHPRSPDAVRRP